MSLEHTGAERADAGADVVGLPDPASVERLVSRYDVPGPRYTSYPTAPVWTDDFGAREFGSALGSASGRDLAIYVHVPFCESLCTYCACNREIHRDHRVADPYLDDLQREADQLARALGATSPAAQLAVGGGTPTYLSPEQLARMCDIVDTHFPPLEGAERSIEVDPRVTSVAQLEILAARGFNRISLGVQDLSSRVQRAIHRIQSRAQTEAVADSARALGFRSVNLDLIYGLPYQTPTSFAETLRAVVAMRPDRIALYSYAHVTWVSKQQRGFERKNLPSASEKAALFLLAIQRLCEAGYAFVGLDHFALPDDELFRAAESGTLRRNFMGYTTQPANDLVALGPSAISELSDSYAQSARTSDEWSEQLRGGRLATVRGWSLSQDDKRRHFLIEQLMCVGKVDGNAYAAVWGEDLHDRVPGLEDRLAPFVADGLLIPGEASWRLTPVGRIFVRTIAMAFDAYLDSRTSTGARPMFSRTV